MAAFTIIRADGVTALVFDGALDYTLTATVDITDHPVERDVNVSDHAKINPKNLAGHGVVTESPLSTAEGIGGPARVTAATAFLDAIRGENITLVTQRFGTLQNMMLTRYVAPAENARRIVYDFEFKQIRIAEAGLVTLPASVPSTESAANGLSDHQDLGEQPTTTTEKEPEQEARDTSVLLDALTALGLEP